jgi:5-hydroxyisourate hydrolase-like protein (transthyretin family)
MSEHVDENGRCSECRIKVKHYKRDNYKVCHRCGRYYSVETGKERSSPFGWKRIPSDRYLAEKGEATGLESALVEAALRGGAI